MDPSRLPTQSEISFLPAAINQQPNQVNHPKRWHLSLWPTFPSFVQKLWDVFQLKHDLICKLKAFLVCKCWTIVYNLIQFDFQGFSRQKCIQFVDEIGDFYHCGFNLPIHINNLPFCQQQIFICLHNGTRFLLFLLFLRQLLSTFNLQGI